MTLVEMELNIAKLKQQKQEQDLTNQEKQNTAKKLAELNTELSLIGQRRDQVAQETEKLKALIQADEEKQVAEIRGDTGNTACPAACRCSTSRPSLRSIATGMRAANRASSASRSARPATSCVTRNCDRRLPEVSTTQS